MIHVCFCFQDRNGRYTKFVGTAVLSIFENAVISPYSITVHILHDNTLTDDNRDKFNYLAGRYSQLVKFYNVDELCADRIAEIRKVFPQVDKTRFSIAMFYRFFISNVLPTQIEKVIYLDADIIVNLDISELWQIELGEKVLGVITHENIGMIDIVKKRHICSKGFVHSIDSFNSGVLLINLSLLRNEETTLSKGIKFIHDHPENKFLDQDILNYCFSTRTLKLPVKFNQFVREARLKKEFPTKKIYHYIVDTLSFNFKDTFNQLWMSYFIRTPFFDANSMGRLYDDFLKMRSELKISAMKLSAIVAGKTRAFFIEPTKIDSIKKAFLIRDDEKVLLAKNEESIQNLFDEMKNSKGKIVFFIMTKKVLKKSFPFNTLIKEGFVENVDFVKGWNYLDTPLNSYPLVQAM